MINIFYMTKDGMMVCPDHSDDHKANKKLKKLGHLSKRAKSKLLPPISSGWGILISKAMRVRAIEKIASL